MIERKKYLDRLINKKENGLVKVITGIRRCGKSYLLFNIYKNYLKSIGVADECIICLALDDDENIQYRNPLELGKHIRSLTTDESKTYYVFLDEIRVSPLSFEEFYNAFDGDKRDAWQEYYTYGGLPLVMKRKGHEEKAKYLQTLFDRIYLSDIIERNKILHDTSVLDDILNITSSAVGSLTNANKIANTFKSERKVNISDDTVSRYLDYFIDAFMLYKAERYDVKGRQYIGSPLKYYFSDVGLRNERLNFRQQEENRIMENIIYNELLNRDFNVDVGVVEYNYKDENKKSKRTQLEIDFIANKGSKKYYIQSALTVADEEKRNQETRSLKRVNDSFRKIVVVKDHIFPSP